MSARFGADAIIANDFNGVVGVTLVICLAFVAVNRAQPTRPPDDEEQPLTWMDVERHLLRAERRQRREPPPPG